MDTDLDLRVYVPVMDNEDFLDAPGSFIGSERGSILFTDLFRLTNTLFHRCTNEMCSETEENGSP